MVWFQCEDCGDNLKKPKLPNHFRVCSAFKLSCIDCGGVFGQHNVESHTQCISEAEKYGPKGGNFSNGVNSKPKVSKPKPEVDINVGLSDRPPWFCSLCNTKATSQQTLLLHADGKKHRGKAKGFHAANQLSNDAKETITENIEQTVRLSKDLGEPKDQNMFMVAPLPGTENDISKAIKKRKLEVSDLKTEGVTTAELSNDDDTAASKNLKKTKRCMEDEKLDSTPEELGKKKIKWKKLITSALKSKSDGVLKLKKLKKVVLRSVEESGLVGDKTQVSEMLEHKIKSSSRFVIDGKNVRLATSE